MVTAHSRLSSWSDEPVGVGLRLPPDLADSLEQERGPRAGTHLPRGARQAAELVGGVDGDHRHGGRSDGPAQHVGPLGEDVGSVVRGPEGRDADHDHKLKPRNRVRGSWGQGLPSGDSGGGSPTRWPEAAGPGAGGHIPLRLRADGGALLLPPVIPGLPRGEEQDTSLSGSRGGDPEWAWTRSLASAPGPLLLALGGRGCPRPLTSGWLGWLGGGGG